MPAPGNWHCASSARNADAGMAGSSPKKLRSSRLKQKHITAGSSFLFLVGRSPLVTTGHHWSRFKFGEGRRALKVLFGKQKFNMSVKL